jgi:large subunit ribosomal protein L35
MPKVKTKKSITKRFKVTKNGKIFRKQNFSGHLRVKQSRSKKRAQKRQVEMKGYYAKKLRKFLGVSLSK